MVLAALLQINSLYFWILNSLLMIYMYIFDFVDHFRMQILLDFDSLSCWVSLFLLSQSLPSLTPKYTVSRTPVVLKKKPSPVHVHMFMLWLSSPSQDTCTLNSLSDHPCFLFLHSFFFFFFGGSAMPVSLWNFTSLSGIEPGSSAVKM